MTLIILASLLAKHPTVTEALRVLVNAVTVHVGTGPNLSDLRTNEDLTDSECPAS